jgi:hypothetical protein
MYHPINFFCDCHPGAPERIRKPCFRWPKQVRRVRQGDSQSVVTIWSGMIGKFCTLPHMFSYAAIRPHMEYETTATTARTMIADAYGWTGKIPPAPPSWELPCYQIPLDAAKSTASPLPKLSDSNWDIERHRDQFHIPIRFPDPNKHKFYSRKTSLVIKSETGDRSKILPFYTALQELIPQAYYVRDYVHNMADSLRSPPNRLSSMLKTNLLVDPHSVKPAQTSTSVDAKQPTGSISLPTPPALSTISSGGLTISVSNDTISNPSSATSVHSARKPFEFGVTSEPFVVPSTTIDQFATAQSTPRSNVVIVLPDSSPSATLTSTPSLSSLHRTDRK